MELGKLQFDWEQSKEAIALISYCGTGEGNFSLVQSLVSEASVRYPQLNQLSFVHVPLPISRLESWSYYLAAQVTAQWRELPMPEQSVQIIVDELGLNLVGTRETLSATLDKIGTPLTLQLAKRVELLKQRQQELASYQKRWLELEATGLAQWFSGLTPTPSGSDHSLVEDLGCLTQLQSNVLTLRAKLLRSLRDCFAQTQHIGSRSLLTWLASLIKTFDGIRTDYEVQRQDNLRRESSAWRAYYHLNSRLEQRSWGLFGSTRSDWEAALSALACAYKFKLQAEIYTQSAQLVGELAQQTRLYADEVEQLDAMLASLQNYFTSRGDIEPLFLPFLQQQLSQLNSRHLRSELESWMGFPFNQWSILESTQTTALGGQILARIRPLCLEVYAECCRCILNLESPNYHTPPPKTQTPASAELSSMLSDAEKRVSLQVDKADIQYVLEQLALMGQVCVIADKSIRGTVSLVLDEVPLTEAMDAVAAACNLTYTKSSSIYTFNQTPDSPATIIPEPSVTSPSRNQMSS